MFLYQDIARPTPLCCSGTPSAYFLTSLPTYPLAYPLSLYVLQAIFCQIRDETDTKIDLPTEKSESDAIVVTGRKENVERACDMILAIEKEMVGGDIEEGEVVKFFFSPGLCSG